MLDRGRSPEGHLPAEAAVVIVGGGVAGCSIAYHLTRMGRRDVLVLERAGLTGGSTFHSAGLVGLLRSSVSLTRMMMYSSELYDRLESETGIHVGWRKVGSLRLASSPERLLELKRLVGWAKTFGLPLELIGAREARDRFPIMNIDGVLGAVYLPLDGYLDPSGLTHALARGARSAGATIATGVRVEEIKTANGRVDAVRTDHGLVRCAVVVNAAGIWAPHIGAMAGVTVPIIPMEHQYLVTKPLEVGSVGVAGAINGLPTMRDPDLLVYYRPDGSGGLVMGGYERQPRHWGLDGISPDFNHRLLAPDHERFEEIMLNALRRTPCLEHAGVVRFINGPEAFTPDGEFILGESPEVKGFFVAAGFCAHGIAGAGGVGKMMAEWIVEGRPSLDLWRMDMRRFGHHYAARQYTLARVSEVYRTYYDIHYPNEERHSARGLRLSPIHSRLAGLGAVFGEKNAWERPNFFVRHAERRSAINWIESFGTQPSAVAAIAAEHAACRGRVAMFDLTSFSKIEVAGHGALDFIQRLTDNQMNKPPGSVTYTQMLNEAGGIESDVTVTRMSAKRFMLITGAAFGEHDLDWLRSHAPAGGSLSIHDVTDQYCCIGLWGPRARDVLSRTTSADISNSAFPYLSAQRIDVGSVPVLALRVTYVGELGWELYAPIESGRSLWDTLWEVGQPSGLTAGGYRAIDSMRLEKGYRYWSADITPECNPFEAGLGFCVKLAKGDFIGREALLAVKARGLTRRLCCMSLTTNEGRSSGVDDRNSAGQVHLHSPMLTGGEPVLYGQEVVGRVSSGGFGYTVGRAIAYGYLPIELSAPGTRVSIEVFGEALEASVEREPLYDPTGEKLKS